MTSHAMMPCSPVIPNSCMNFTGDSRNFRNNSGMEKLTGCARVIHSPMRTKTRIDMSCSGEASQFTSWMTGWLSRSHTPTMAHSVVVAPTSGKTPSVMPSAMVSAIFCAVTPCVNCAMINATTRSRQKRFKGDEWVVAGMVHGSILLPDQNLRDARIRRQLEQRDEHIRRHRNVSKQQNGDEPAGTRQPARLLVKQPRVKRQETKVAIEQRGDEPRMHDHVVRRLPERTLRARPARGAEHGDEHATERDAEEPDHRLVKV